MSLMLSRVAVDIGNLAPTWRKRVFMRLERTGRGRIATEELR
jgi:hypothetical protein